MIQMNSIVDALDDKGFVAENVQGNSFTLSNDDGVGGDGMRGWQFKILHEIISNFGCDFTISSHNAFIVNIITEKEAKSGY